MKFFIADTHFGHRSMINFCDRPFETVEEMDQAMIDLWNARVKDEDDVYILGDMIYRHKDPESILKKLKGKKYLILGNHDWTWRHTIPAEKYFEKIDYYMEVQVNNDWCVLSHYPMLSYRSDSKHFMIHGHIHNDCSADFWPLLVSRPLILNAGVDINGFQPVMLPELIANNKAFKEMHPLRETKKTSYEDDQNEG